MAANFSALPPWGFMDLGEDEYIASRPVPEHWNEDKSLWKSWLQTVIDVVSRDLWPVYADDGAVWQTAHVDSLFQSDFRLLKSLRLHLDQPISGAVPTNVLHHEFFDLEDKDSTLFGTGYEAYEPTMTLAARKVLIDGMNIGIVDKMGSIDAQMKMVFQRPRPWQVAKIKKLDYNYRVALSAYTPSLISGHCISGVMAGCGAFELLSTKYPGMSMEVLQQFTVDIGDRRVMAGVHYPSDNLSSWYSALRLIPKVFDKTIVPAVKRFLWGAISGKSIVFSNIRSDIDANKAASPYAAIVSQLEKEAYVPGS